MRDHIGGAGTHHVELKKNRPVGAERWRKIISRWESVPETSSDPGRFLQKFCGSMR